MTKSMSFASTFYPNDKSELLNYFNSFNNALDSNLKDTNILNLIPKALICPHAGYIYSGFSANFAYRLLANSNAKRIIVIAPSHRISFDGISGLTDELYDTPLGKIDVDLDYLGFLKTKFNIGYHKDIHKEHSSETQMPFIKHYANHTKVLELIYSNIDYNYLSSLIEYLLEDDNNLIIISTDLSHFFSKDEAYKKDKKCLDAIQDLNLNIYNDGCEACGGIGVKAMIKTAKYIGLNSHILDYRTSFEYSKDDTSVVGYTSAVFC